jgi:dihydrofolate reductase
VSKVRVFIASSLDGFIAGPNDELDWLPSVNSEVEDTFTPFMSGIGALLMGRRTYEVARGFDGPWPYGDTPVLVVTKQALGGAPASVSSVSGEVATLVKVAKSAAGERDVYVDGGMLIRSTLDAGLIDEMTVTLVPIVLGQGIPLFAGCFRRHALGLVSSRPIGGGLIQVTYDVRGRGASDARIGRD